MKTLVQLLKEVAMPEEMDEPPEDLARARALFDDAAKMVDNFLARTKHYNEVERGRVATLFVYELISRLPLGKQEHAIEEITDQQERMVKILRVFRLKEVVTAELKRRGT